MKSISKEKITVLRAPSFSLEEKRRLVAYLDGLQAQVAKVRGLQEESARELEALTPGILN